MCFGQTQFSFFFSEKHAPWKNTIWEIEPKAPTPHLDLPLTLIFALSTHSHLLPTTHYYQSLAWTDVCKYLTPRHDATTVAILLGVSASKVTFIPPS